MSEYKKIRKETDWADREPEEDGQDTGYEKTYRDGSAVNECWRDRDESV